MRWICWKRLTVTSSHIKVWSMQAAQNYEISSLHTYSGWLQNFLRRSRIYSSCKLFGEGSSELRASTLFRMEEISDTMLTYGIINIYNRNESGLLCSIGSSQICLSQEKVRQETRRTTMQPHKNRIAVVLSVNAYRSFAVPITSIGQSKTPTPLKIHII